MMDMPEKGTVMKGQIGPGQVQAVYFDAVGTLLHPQPPAAEVYATVGSRFGSRYSLPEIDRRFRVAFRKQERADRAAGSPCGKSSSRRRSSSSRSPTSRRPRRSGRGSAPISDRTPRTRSNVPIWSRPGPARPAPACKVAPLGQASPRRRFRPGHRGPDRAT